MTKGNLNKKGGGMNRKWGLKLKKMHKAATILFNSYSFLSKGLLLIS